MQGVWAQSAVQGENKEVRVKSTVLVVIGLDDRLTGYGLQDGAIRGEVT